MTPEALIIAAREARRVSPDILPELKRAEREHTRLCEEHALKAAALRKRIRMIRKATKGNTEGPSA